MLKLEQPEYVEHKDVLKLVVKVFNLIKITIFLKNTISNNKNCQSKFHKSYFLFDIYLDYNEEKSRYNAKILIFKCIHINFFIPVIVNRIILSDILNLEYARENFNKIINIKKPIDIIIPIYNGFQHLSPLFESIFNSTHIDYRLILIDDKSTDNRVLPFLESLNFDNDIYCKDILLLKNEENLGFIKSVNKACQFTKNHFILLNSDVVLPNDWINRLIYPIINNINIASVTPFTNSGTICSFPNFCADNKLFLDLDVNSIDLAFSTIPINIAYQDIPTAVGFCMAINKDIFDEIGDLDTIYGKGYVEENDWCMRAYNKGYRHLIAGNLFVYHNHGGSFLSEEKEELVKTNNSILIKKYPKYKALINDYLKKDPLKLIRISNILKLIPFNQIKKNIIFSHNLGGGAEIYLTNYIKDKINNELFIIVKEYSLYDFYHNKNKYIFSLKYKNIDIELIFYNLCEIMTILDSFNIKSINNIIINHLISFNLNKIVFFILNLKNKYKAEIIFKVHDFLVICKRHNLLYKDKYFCDIPKDLSICNECLDDFDIKEYRKYFEILLTNSIIETFSNSSKKLIMKAYKNLNPNNIIVNPHKIDWINRKAKNTNNTNSLHVGILGIISFHKGLFILEKLLNLVKEDNIIFYSFGQCDLINNKLINVGEYNHDNIVDLVDQYDIDVFIMPSICPETFSYTTEEIILMDKPIMVFNLGAPAERVANYNKGYIIDEVSAKAMYNELLKFYKNNKVIEDE